MEVIIPYELSTINNIDLRKIFEQDYQIFYFNMDRDITQIDTPNEDDKIIKVLLNPEKTYLFVCNSLNKLITVISPDDVLLRNYIKKDNVWYAIFKFKWQFNKLNKIVFQCENCCDYYFHEDTTSNKCKTCEKCKFENRI